MGGAAEVAVGLQDPIRHGALTGVIGGFRGANGPAIGASESIQSNRPAFASLGHMLAKLGQHMANMLAEAASIDGM